MSGAQVQEAIVHHLLHDKQIEFVSADHAPNDAMPSIYTFDLCGTGLRCSIGHIQVDTSEDSALEIIGKAKAVLGKAKAVLGKAKAVLGKAKAVLVRDGTYYGHHRPPHRN